MKKKVLLLITTILMLLGHELLAHDEQDPAEIWTKQFYQNFINYHLKSQQPNLNPVHSSPSLRVWGQKIALDSQFYELMRWSLKSVSTDFNHFCDTCLIEEVKQQATNPHWVTQIETKLNSLTELRASIGGIKQEYGHMALVGYVMMEVLEHTFLGPLGICPILNVIYFSSLDTFKSMGQSFNSSRDFRRLGLPSLTLSIRTGLKIFLLKKQAKNIVFEFSPQARSQCTALETNSLATQHIQHKLKKTFFWQENQVSQLSAKLKHYIKLSKKQKRYRWLNWKTAIQKQFSRRLLWPIAYQELVLDPSLNFIFHPTDLEDVTPVTDQEQLPSIDFNKDLAVIFSADEPAKKRFMTALYIHEYFYLIKKMFQFLLHEDLEAGYITRSQYLQSHHDLIQLTSLQVDFANYLLMASQQNHPQKLKQALFRAQTSLAGQLTLIPILDHWLKISSEDNLNDRILIQSQLREWTQKNLIPRPWRKPKIRLIDKIKSCTEWLSE